MSILKMRTREVLPVRARDWTGIPGDSAKIKSVFPLSPSTVVWGWDKGCTLARFLRKGHGMSVKMGHYVLRGQILDNVVGLILEAKIRGDEMTPDEMEQAIFTRFYEIKDDYDTSEIRDEGTWLEAVLGLLLAWREHRLDEVRPYSTQQKIWLYLGDEPIVDIPDDPDWAPPDPENWAMGFLDWLEEGGGGFDVYDLKVTSRPTRKQGSVGDKYRLQLMFYAAGLWQSGVKVNRVYLDQMYPKSMQSIVVSEQFTQRDYERVILKFRQVRDHYLSIYNGTGDFIIPLANTGICSGGNFDCDYHPRCPMGAGSPERMKV